MNQEKTADILIKPISKLSISDHLRGFMETKGYNNIDELMKSYSISQLLSEDGFNYHSLTELHWLIERNGCYWPSAY